LGGVDEGCPDILHAPLELRQRAVVLDDEVGPRAFELGGHLRRNHVHGLSLAESAVGDETLEAHAATRVDENDPVEAIGHVALEQERNVAHDHAIAPLPRLFHQPRPQPLDFRMNDLVKFFKLFVVGKHDAAQRGAIEMAVGSEHLGAPAGDDLLERGRTELDRAPRQDVGVDDRRAALRQHLRDGRFPAADVARESNKQHDGFLEDDGRSLHPARPSYGPMDRASTPINGEGVNHTALEETNGEAASAEFEQLIHRQLELLGEDPDREGLLRTPHRVATSLAWLTRGYEMDVQQVVNGALFEAEGASNMVMVRDIELYSLCEHHMLPFYGKAHIAYIPSGKIVGLSKLPRIVEVFARRLQVQERLTEQIAGAIDDVLKPQGVGVVIEAYHLCMMMRGVEKQNSKTITSAVRGLFRSDQRTREEFLTLAYAPRQ
jgi:GTP cyclohydrolase IA